MPELCPGIMPGILNSPGIIEKTVHYPQERSVLPGLLFGQVEISITTIETKPNDREPTISRLLQNDTDQQCCHSRENGNPVFWMPAFVN